MGLYESGGQLNKAIKELMNRWGETRALWDDAMARDFEQKHLLPLQMDLRNALTALGSMNTLLEQIRRDCT